MQKKANKCVLYHQVCKWPYPAYRHKVSWVADESYNYCSKMGEIIPRQTVHSMYRKNGSVENTYELSSVHNIAILSEHATGNLSCGLSRVQRMQRDLHNSFILHVIHNPGLVIMGNQTELSCWWNNERCGQRFRGLDEWRCSVAAISNFLSCFWAFKNASSIHFFIHFFQDISL